MPLPAYDARLETFKIYTQNLRLDKNVDLKKLATMTEGYSGSDIRDLIQAAHIKVVRDFFENGNPEDSRAGLREIDMQDFNSIINVRKPSVPNALIKNYDHWSKEFSAL